MEDTLMDPPNNTPESQPAEGEGATRQEAKTEFHVTQDVGKNEGRVVGVEINEAANFTIVTDSLKLAERPALFAGVPAKPKNFVGREELVASLVVALTSGGEVALSLDGMPGVGKTTLAVALARDSMILAHFADGVLWASLGPHGKAFNALAGWAQALGRDISCLTELEDRHEAVKQLIGQRRLLLVIDDVWDIHAALALQCGGPYCCYLLTSRDLGIASSFAGKERAGRVPALNDEAAYQLLHVLAPEACDTDPATARRLSAALGGLPLSIELVGGYLAAPERAVFPELSQAALAQMADPARRLELASVRLGDRRAGEVKLKETIQFSLETLTQEARAAFYALGAFAPQPDHFSREAAEAVARTDARTLALLVARNLLDKTKKTGDELSLHQTLADLARTNLPLESAARHRDYYLSLVDQDQGDWRQIEPVYGQIRWAWANISEDEGLLDWVYALGVYQGRRGLWRDQIAWIERGLHVAEAQGLRRHQGTLLNNMAAIYDDIGQPQKALELYEQALPITREVGDRAGEATTLNNMGLVYQASGQPQKALELYEQALPIRREVGDRAGEAVTLNNMGGVYQAIGQLQRALELYEQALLIQREVGDSYDESVTRYNLAMIYRDQGRLEEAVAELRRVVEIDRQIGHPDLESDQSMLRQMEGELEGGVD